MPSGEVHGDDVAKDVGCVCFGGCGDVVGVGSGIRGGSLGSCVVFVVFLSRRRRRRRGRRRDKTGCGQGWEMDVDVPRFVAVVECVRVRV